MIQAPPYALVTPVFRFRALASHAGRAALGGDREIALACFAVARLAAGMVAPFALIPADAATRVANTKQWIASLALPAGHRAAVVAVADAVALGNKRSVVSALSGMIETAVRNLDQASIAEIHELMGELG
ncbi:MAG TPA: hypothetical protein VF042_07660 [Gemmatimonadaceae bacterium]